MLTVDALKNAGINNPLSLDRAEAQRITITYAEDGDTETKTLLELMDDIAYSWFINYHYDKEYEEGDEERKTDMILGEFSTLSLEYYACSSGRDIQVKSYTV